GARGSRRPTTRPFAGSIDASRTPTPGYASAPAAWSALANQPSASTSTASPVPRTDIARTATATMDSATATRTSRLLILRLRRRRQRHRRPLRFLRLRRLGLARRDAVADVVKAPQREERRGAVSQRAVQAARFGGLPGEELAELVA